MEGAVCACAYYADKGSATTVNDLAHNGCKTTFDSTWAKNVLHHQCHKQTGAIANEE